MLKFLSPIFKRKDNSLNSEHVAFIESLSNSLDELNSDTDLMKLELMILTATGKWLDSWGDWFGVPRLLYEEDSVYSKRIIATTIKPKNTIPAIIEAVNEVGGNSGTETTIFEPHKFIARYNISEFSGRDRYQDGNYWRVGVIDLNTPFDITPDIRDAVELVKAAGIKVFFTHKNNLVLSDDSWKFSDGFIPYLEYCLKIEPTLAKSLLGAVFSSDTQGKRSRSGKQTLWGFFVDYGFELNLIRKFERLIGESEVLIPSDFIEYQKIPVKTGSRYSNRTQGVISGGNKNDFILIDHYDPLAKTDLQGEIFHQAVNLRPATHSSHGILSGKYCLSGAKNEGWLDKPYILLSDLKVSFFYSSHRVSIDNDIIYEMSIKPQLQFNKSIRSGRQILFLSDFVTINIDFGVSEQKRVLTFNDPYKWIEYFYAVRKRDEDLKKQILSEEFGNRSGDSFFDFDSVITTKELDEYGINIQKGIERNVIYLGLAYRSLQGRRSGRFPFSGVFNDTADVFDRPLISELVENPYASEVEEKDFSFTFFSETENNSFSTSKESLNYSFDNDNLIARRNIYMSSIFRFEDITPEIVTYKAEINGGYKNHTEFLTETTTVDSFIDFQYPVNIEISA